jgi:hypothetical protein
MKRLVVAFIALGALLAPSTAAAHPLGNFTVNRFAGIELSGERIYPVRPRPRGDPDLPGGQARAPA